MDRRVPTGSFGNERETHMCRGAKGGGVVTSGKGRALRGGTPQQLPGSAAVLGDAGGEGSLGDTS